MSTKYKKITPLRDHVLIEPIKAEEVTESGIMIPATADKERPEQGKIVETGPGKMGKDNTPISMDVKKGDIVLFSKYGPTEVSLNGKEYLVAKQDDIIAVLEN